MSSTEAVETASEDGGMVLETLGDPDEVETSDVAWWGWLLVALGILLLLSVLGCCYR